MPILDLPHPSLSPDALLLQATRVRPGTVLCAQAEAAVPLALTLADPRMIWVERETRPRRDPSALNLLDPGTGRETRLEIPEALPLLTPAVRVLAAVSTLGPLLPEQISAWGRQGNLLGAFFLEVCGNLLLEELTGGLRRLATARAQALPGQGCSPLLYPGSAPGLPLSLQDDLVRLTGAQELGVTVTPQHLLTPRQSVSLLVGLGKYPHREPPSSCTLCPRTDCPYRSEGTSPPAAS